MSLAWFHIAIAIVVLLGLGVVGVVLLLVFLARTNRGGGSVPRREEWEQLREDYERACERIARLEEENRRLQQAQATPGEGHITQ